MSAKLMKFAAVLTVLSMILAGCAAPTPAAPTVVPTAAPKPITLTVWDFKSGDPLFAPYTKDAIKRFQEKNPHVKVELVPQPMAEYYNILGTAISANKGPDVVLLHGDPRLVERQDLLLPLNKYLGKDIDQLAGQEQFKNVKTGELVGTPITIQGSVWYYSKKVYTEAGLDPNKPPKTWDELVANCDVIKTKTQKDCFSIGMKDGNGLHFFMNILVNATFTAQEQADWKARKMPWDHPKMLKVLQMVADANKRGWWQKGYASATLFNDSYDYFISGKSAHVAGLISDSGNWKYLSDGMGADNVGMFKGVTVDPQIAADPSKLPTSATGGIGWSVMKWSPEPDMAVKLVQQLASPESLAVLANSAGAIVARKDVDPASLTNPFMKQIVTWLKEPAFDPWNSVIGTAARNEWHRQAPLLLLGDTTVEKVTAYMNTFEFKK